MAKFILLISLIFALPLRAAEPNPPSFDHRLEGGKFVMTTAGLAAAGGLISDWVGSHFFGLASSPVLTGLFSFGLGISIATFSGQKNKYRVDWNGAIYYQRFGATGLRGGLKLGLKVAVLAGVCQLGLSALAKSRVDHQIKQMDSQNAKP